MLRRGWTTVVAVTLLLLVGAGHAQGQQAPVVLKVTPSQVAPGSQNVKLTIEGKNFAPGAKVSFSGSGVLPVPGSVKVISPTELHVKIQVALKAALGARNITVRNLDNLTGTGKGLLKIGATVAVAPIAGARVAPIAAVARVGPVIQSFWPTQGTPGEPFWLSIHGSNFGPEASVKFDPPTGIQVLTTLFEPKRILIQIKIEPSAPLEPRQVKVVLGGMTATAKAAFKVVPVLPVVLKVTPNFVRYIGQGYVQELKIEGKNFALGATVAFSGTEVSSAEAAKVISPTEIRQKVYVGCATWSGTRDITVKNPHFGGIVAAGTGKGLLDFVAVACPL